MFQNACRADPTLAVPHLFPPIPFRETIRIDQQAPFPTERRLWAGNSKSSLANIDQLARTTDEPGQIKTFSEAVKSPLHGRIKHFFVTSSTLNPVGRKSAVFRFGAHRIGWAGGRLGSGPVTGRFSRCWPDGR